MDCKISKSFIWSAVTVVMIGGLAMAAGPAVDKSPLPDILLNDFEGRTSGDWIQTGEAFRSIPFRPADNKRIDGMIGAAVAWSGRGNVQAKGTLLSPPFQIERRFINFLIRGERNLPGLVGVELLQDNRVIRSSSATELRGTEPMYWRTWDVSEFAGQTVQIRVNDNTEAGDIIVEQFVQSASAKSFPIDAANLFNETYRPQFHYTAQCGWMNDANGLTYYNGKWLLFHQYGVHGQHDSRVWGHAVSDDLLSWHRKPPAIPFAENVHIASGSGLVDWTNASKLQNGRHPPLLLFYTSMPTGPDGFVPNGTNNAAAKKTTQCLVYSTDGGETWQKYADNPLLRTQDYKDRDPKVFYHEPTQSWIMVLSLSADNINRESAACFGFFRSTDLKNWELTQKLGPGPWYWECPDFFQLPVDGDATRSKWVLLKGSADYIIGSFDGRTFTPDPGDGRGYKPETGINRTHWGGNYYGNQTFSAAPNGRRVVIGWMSTGKMVRSNAYLGMPFNQQMSFPRELTLRTTPEGVRLFFWPVAEIEKLCTDTQTIRPRAIQPGDNALSSVPGDLLDIEIEIDLMQAKQLQLTLRGQEIVYDVAEQKLKAFGIANPMFATINGKLNLRILMDRPSIEIFGNKRPSRLIRNFLWRSRRPLSRPYRHRRAGQN